jgi:hypothetical protein
MIYYLIARRHQDTMHHFLFTWGKALAGRIKVVLYEDLFSGATIQLPVATYIFTSLGRDMGSYDPPSPVRKLASELHSSLVKACGAGRVLNDPAHALQRYDLLRALEERGINRFAAYRAGGAAIPRRYPVFLRWEHGSLRDAPPLLHTPQDYEAAIRDATGEESIAVEFCDTSGNSGVYRKYGCFVVGGRIVPRHLFFSRSWLVKRADLCEPAMVEEELEFLETNPHAPVLQEACRIARIEYGRVDYALVDGQPQVWEINDTPGLVPSPVGHDPARDRAQARFVELFSRALDAIDPPAS